MSRKHYTAAAQVIRETAPLSHRERIAEGFAEMFAADNPRFERERFYAACGLSEWRSLNR